MWFSFVYYETCLPQFWLTTSVLRDNIGNTTNMDSFVTRCDSFRVPPSDKKWNKIELNVILRDSSRAPWLVCRSLGLSFDLLRILCCSGVLELHSGSWGFIVAQDSLVIPWSRCYLLGSFVFPWDSAFTPRLPVAKGIHCFSGLVYSSPARVSLLGTSLSLDFHSLGLLCHVREPSLLFLSLELQSKIKLN